MNVIQFVTTNTESLIQEEPTVKRVVTLKMICEIFSFIKFIYILREKCKNDDCASKCIKAELGDDEGGLGSI